MLIEERIDFNLFAGCRTYLEINSRFPDVANSFPDGCEFIPCCVELIPCSLAQGILATRLGKLLNSQMFSRRILPGGG
jgi:hypothetical protein